MSHESHCCIVHGCKYGEYNTCPVCTGQVLQQYLCAECYNQSYNDIIGENYKENIEILWDKVHKKSLKENRRLKLAKIKSNVQK